VKVNIIIMAILITGVAGKLVRYSEPPDMSANNLWQQPVARLMLQAGYQNPRRINVTRSGDMQALKLYLPACKADLNITLMPGYDEFIQLWEQLAYKQQSTAFYVMNGREYERFPTAKYWLAVIGSALPWQGTHRSNSNSQVYAVSWPHSCNESDLLHFYDSMESLS